MEYTNVRIIANIVWDCEEILRDIYKCPMMYYPNRKECNGYIFNKPRIAASFIARLMMKLKSRGELQLLRVYALNTEEVIIEFEDKTRYGKKIHIRLFDWFNMSFNKMITYSVPSLSTLFYMCYFNKQRYNNILEDFVQSNMDKLCTPILTAD